MQFTLSFYLQFLISKNFILSASVCFLRYQYMRRLLSILQLTLRSSHLLKCSVILLLLLQQAETNCSDIFLQCFNHPQVQVDLVLAISPLVPHFIKRKVTFISKNKIGFIFVFLDFKNTNEGIYLLKNRAQKFCTFTHAFFWVFYQPGDVARKLLKTRGSVC